MSERCEAMFPHLSAMVDGEVDDDIRASVGVHLADCAICSDRLETMQALRGALHDMVNDDPPPKFAEEAEAWVRAQPRRSTSPPAWMIVLAIVSALVVIAVGTISGWIGGGIAAVVAALLLAGACWRQRAATD